MAARRLPLFSAETPIDDDAVQHGCPFVRPRDRIPLYSTSTRHEFPRRPFTAFSLIHPLTTRRRVVGPNSYSFDAPKNVTGQEFNECIL